MIALPAAVTNTEGFSQEVPDWLLSLLLSSEPEVGSGLGSPLARPVYRIWKLHNCLH